jgi:hypothetical protein
MLDVPWRRQIRATCFVCDRPRLPGERFSARGKCPDCGNDRMIQNVHDLEAHKGEFFDHWRKRCLAAFGVNE